MVINTIKKSIRKRNVIYGLISIILAVTLISLTIGKEIIAGKQLSLLSFAMVNFSGYLFFFLLPVETLIPFYVSAGYNGWLLFSIALSTAVVAQAIDYFIGYVMSEGIINNLIGKEKFNKYQNYIEKYSGSAILIFNLFPLASSVLSLMAGMVRYKIKKFWFFSILGLSIKYLALIFLFNWLFF
tara:strand:+ start:97 stop:648 length:552 start_codon:yes stop_codon:yes gene_type:complete